MSVCVRVGIVVFLVCDRCVQCLRSIIVACCVGIKKLWVLSLSVLSLLEDVVS